jgi:CBS-domain-containing membrane protein
VPLFSAVTGFPSSLQILLSLSSPSAIALFRHLNRQFRTLGMRHMVVVDSDHKVVGMITRTDLTESRLEAHWHREVR